MDNNQVQVPLTVDELARIVLSLGITCQSLLARAKRTTGSRHDGYIAERAHNSALQIKLQQLLDEALTAA